MESTLIKVRKKILSLCSKMENPDDRAVIILTYYFLHISPSRPKGSYISVELIKKSFNLITKQDTTESINKLLKLIFILFIESLQLQFF
jgi:hypothetical protein